MANDSSKISLTPRTEEEILPRSAQGKSAPPSPSERIFSNSELKRYDSQKRIEDRVSTQKLARFLVGFLLLCFLGIYIAGFAVGEGSKFAEAKENIFPVLQAALFTVLGFVFGEKVSGKESD